MSMDGGAYVDVDFDWQYPINVENEFGLLLDPMAKVTSGYTDISAMAKPEYWSGYKDYFKDIRSTKRLPAFEELESQKKQVRQAENKNLVPYLMIGAALALFVLLRFNKREG